MNSYLQLKYLLHELKIDLDGRSQEKDNFGIAKLIMIVSSVG